MQMNTSEELSGELVTVPVTEWKISNVYIMFHVPYTFTTVFTYFEAKITS